MIKIDGQVDYVLLVLFRGDRNEEFMVYLLEDFLNLPL